MFDRRREAAARAGAQDGETQAGYALRLAALPAAALASEHAGHIKYLVPPDRRGPRSDCA